MVLGAAMCCQMALLIVVVSKLLRVTSSITLLGHFHICRSQFAFKVLLRDCLEMELRQVEKEKTTDGEFIGLG